MPLLIVDNEGSLMTQPDAASSSAALRPRSSTSTLSEAREVHPGLIIGILFLPVICAWFLLRPGYSTQARILAFGWVGLLMIVSFITPPAPKAGAPATTIAQTTKEPAGATPSAAPVGLAKTANPTKAVATSNPTQHSVEANYLDLLAMDLEDTRKSGMIHQEDEPQATWGTSLSAMSATGDFLAKGNKIALSPRAKAKREAYRREMSAFQAKDFPRLRMIHAQYLNDALWEDNIDVEATGPGHSTLRFTGFPFAANRNIKAMMEKVYDDATASRFRRLEFRSHPGDGTTFYKLDALPDTTIASLSFNRWTVAQ